mmetsp:Transcript_8730/g.27534  ORF Transcript_8730/g.27534 Transcript_8730/m.27534 type:complete len:203 (+) Transcript_8730:226-834(+)
MPCLLGRSRGAIAQPSRAPVQGAAVGRKRRSDSPPRRRNVEHQCPAQPPARQSACPSRPQPPPRPWLRSCVTRQTPSPSRPRCAHRRPPLQLRGPGQRGHRCVTRRHRQRQRQRSHTHRQPMLRPPHRRRRIPQGPGVSAQRTRTALSGAAPLCRRPQLQLQLRRWRRQHPRRVRTGWRRRAARVRRRRAACLLRSAAAARR